MDLIRQVLKTRQDMHKPKETDKKKETEGITLTTIIEDKPKNSEVVKYFRTRADQLDGSNY
jgi:hypothetical protein